jgi:hypothetical protein
MLAKEIVLKMMMPSIYGVLSPLHSAAGNRIATQHAAKRKIFSVDPCLDKVAPEY